MERISPDLCPAYTSATRLLTEYRSLQEEADRCTEQQRAENVVLGAQIDSCLGALKIAYRRLSDNSKIVFLSENPVEESLRSALAA